MNKYIKILPFCTIFFITLLSASENSEALRFNGRETTAEFVEKAQLIADEAEAKRLERRNDMARFSEDVALTLAWAKQVEQENILRRSKEK